MRLFIAVLVLIFNLQSLTKADDVRVFEIEGMSVGDSLLDYFSEKEIKESLSGPQYPKDDFILVWFNNLISFKTYDSLTVAYKSNDKSYTIYNIIGSLHFKNNFKDCFEQKDIILKELSHLFENSKVNSYTYKHAHDKTGKSMMYQVTYDIDSGGSADIFCVNWSKKLEQEENRVDELGVSISLKEFDIFVESVFD